MAKRMINRAAKAHPVPRPPTVPKELVPIIERAYSAIALCVTVLESQRPDCDIDAARVLRCCALQPLGDLAFPLDAEGDAS